MLLVRASFGVINDTFFVTIGDVCSVTDILNRVICVYGIGVHVYLDATLYPLLTLKINSLSGPGLFDSF